MKTVRRPPYPKWNPGYLPCSSLTPLPLSSRRPSVSFGGFGVKSAKPVVNLGAAALKESERKAVDHARWREIGRFRAYSGMHGGWPPGTQGGSATVTSDAVCPRPGVNVTLSPTVGSHPGGLVFPALTLNSYLVSPSSLVMRPLFSGGFVQETSPVAAEAVELPHTGSNSRTPNRPSSAAVRIRFMMASLGTYGSTRTETNQCHSTASIRPGDAQQRRAKNERVRYVPRRGPPQDDSISSSRAWPRAVRHVPRLGRRSAPCPRSALVES